MNKQTRTPEQVEELNTDFAFNKTMFAIGAVAATAGAVLVLGGLAGDDFNLKQAAWGTLSAVTGYFMMKGFRSNKSEIVPESKQHASWVETVAMEEKREQIGVVSQNDQVSGKKFGENRIRMQPVKG